MMSAIEKMRIVELIGRIHMSCAEFEDLLDEIYNYGQSLLETQKLAHLEIVSRIGETARKTENLYSGFSAAMEIEKRIKKHGIHSCTPEHHATYEMLVHSPLMLRKR